MVSKDLTAASASLLRNSSQCFCVSAPCGGVSHALPHALTLQGSGSHNGFVPWKARAKEPPAFHRRSDSMQTAELRASASPVLADHRLI